MSFHSFANRAIDDSDRRQSTKDNLKTTLAALNNFRKGVDFKDLTYSFVKEFETWLKNQNKALNTVAKHLRQLRTLINEAINEGYMKQEEYPFRKFKIKKEQGKHTFLMPDELRRLEALEPEEPRQKHILDAFLFCVYSGLRYSDFKSLTDENIIAIRGQKWLQLKMQKTNIEIRSPLYLLFEGKALDIIGRYKKIADLAGIGDNCNVNRILKSVLTKARIKKRMTWHAARHTCATLLVYDGVQITTVQKLIGHTSLRTTQIYTDVFADAVVKDLKSARRKLKSRNTVETMCSTRVVL